MATVRELRRKIHSVANIQKITQAMEMVAVSRLRRAQAKAELSRPYSRQLKGILDTVMAVSDDLSHPLMIKRETKKIGFVILGGDRGLCGGYNNAIFSTSEKLLKKYPPIQVTVFPVGRKVIDHFLGKNWMMGEQIADWGGKITYAEIERFSQHLMQQFYTSELDEIWLIYTHFIHVASRKIVVEKLLPIDYLKTEGSSSKNYIFEPPAAEIFASLIPHYMITKMQSALHESYASELAARIFSMRAATKNADEMLEKLTLIRNKVRQAGITRELIEITSGAENLN